jgi:hypothetical protein
MKKEKIIEELESTNQFYKSVFDDKYITFYTNKPLIIETVYYGKAYQNKASLLVLNECGILYINTDSSVVGVDKYEHIDTIKVYKPVL